MNHSNSMDTSLESTISIPACFVNVFGATDTGIVRDHNEDNFVLADLSARATGVKPEILRHRVGRYGSLFMVADGMGGGAAGEVASQLAVNHVYHKVSEGVRSIPELDKRNFALQLKSAVEYANGVIYQESLNNPGYKGMGTTCSAAGVFQESLFVAQVGDSRAYLVRSNGIKQITKDQSLVNKLLDAGLITEEEAESHENKNVILQALGIKEAVEVVISTIDVKRNDILILCSDGLSGLVKAEEIKQVVTSAAGQEAACHELVEMANQRGGHDNITVIVAQFSGDAVPPAGPEDTIEYHVLLESHQETGKAARPSEMDVDTREIPKIRSTSEPATGKSFPWVALSVGLLSLLGLVLVLFWIFSTDTPGPSTVETKSKNAVPGGQKPPATLLPPKTAEEAIQKVGQAVSSSIAAAIQASNAQKTTATTLPPNPGEPKISDPGRQSPPENPAVSPTKAIEPVPEPAASASREESAAPVKVEFRLDAELSELIKLGPTGLPIASPHLLKPGFYQIRVLLEKTTCLLPLQVEPGKRNLFVIRKDLAAQGDCRFRVEIPEE